MQGLQPRSRVLLLAAALLAWPALPAAAAASELTLEAASGYVVIAKVNGLALRLRVDPGAPGAILLNPGIAAAAGLTGDRSPVLAVGPIRLNGKAQTASVTIGGVTSRRQFMWFDRDMIVGAEGVINPAELPWDSVRLLLRPRAADEREILLPVTFDLERGLYHGFKFGGETLLTRFTLLDPLTTGTAATGALVARYRGGMWSGPRFTHKVRFSIARPVRSMALRKPLSIKGLTIGSFAVRITDDRGDFRLPAEQPESAESQQRDEIVVSRRRPRVYGPANFWLMVGGADLERCSSIRYSRKPRTLVLTCAQQTAISPAEAPVPATPPAT